MSLQKYVAVLVLIFSLCIVSQSFGQSNTQVTTQQFNKEEFRDSLQKLPPKEFARLYTKLHDQDHMRATYCIEYVKKTMVTSKNLKAQFWGYYCLAHWENYKTNFEASVAYTKKGVEAAVKVNTPDLLLYAYILEGSYYYDYSKYKESMESYLKAIKLAKIVKDEGRQLAISLNIALLKIEVGDNKGAIELLKGTLKIIEEEHVGKFETLKVSLYIALTKSSMRMEEYKKALFYGRKGIELSNQYQDEDAKAYLYNYLAETNIALGNYTKASQLIDKAWKKAHEVESAQSQLPLINLNKAKIYYYKDDYKKTIDILEKVETKQQQKNTNFFNLEDMYKFLAKSYKATGNKEKSLFYFEKANEVYTENDKKQNEIGIDIIKKYDLAELKGELDVVQEKSKAKSIWLYISIFSIGILIVSFAAIYKYKEKQNKKKFEKLVADTESKKEVAAPKVSENKKSYISQTITSEILAKLKKFETKEQFLKKDITIVNLASTMKTNPKYLSRTVNEYKGKSFSNYIKDLRIQYVINRLKNDSVFRSYTIEAIAKEIGYRKAESFSKAFKSKTGLYPSYFIKRLSNQEKV